jgi:HD-GYP domain-containing protein (c-di-GMP phosphodiesterase class II)
MNEVRRHPELSAAIVKSIASLKEVSMVVRQHHERYDGKGYPEGVQGEKIHFAARIMAVADSFDAMTSDRPYRKALDMNDARQELQNGKGTQFDPKCVEAMLQYLGDHKAGKTNPAVTEGRTV